MLSIVPNLLTTQRLILRPWRETDREGFARLNDDPAVMEFMPRRLSRDESDATAASIQAAIERRGWGFWAVEVKGGGGAAARSAAGGAAADAAVEGVAADSAAERGAADVVADGAAAHACAFIGFVGLSVPGFTAHFTPCVEIGWRLAKEHWGNGYASEAAAACLRFGFEKLKLQQIVAFTVPLNKRSIGVMKRIRMSRDPADDFDHPKLSAGHPLQRHVLYRIDRSDWLNGHG
jgi:RimJ/RimL family protein N-acetyltransferase